MSYSLPELNYKYDALEPYIDAKTMDIHYNKHHGAYVQKLNDAVIKVPNLSNRSLEDLLSDLNSITSDVRETIRNNGGGHFNHIQFWNILSPKGGGEPKDMLALQLKAAFGSIEGFKEQFTNAGLNRFGSGWVWLSVNKDKKLVIHSTPNQDTPLAEGFMPVFGLDVWEHAYYLKYQNKRADYIKAFWEVIDWSKVNDIYKASL